MPRIYKCAAVGKKYNQYSSDLLKLAIEELRNGLSYRKCSKKYSIPTTVLHRHSKNHQVKKKGGQTSLSEDEEAVLVDRLTICSDWGYPLDSLTLRLLVKDFLERQGKRVPKFKDNIPGRDWVYCFLGRHKESLSSRMCQNIKRSRAAVSPDTINAYFDELELQLKDVPASHIINYDETNLCDDPGKKKLIFRRGCKYPERVMNSSKASTSVMFAATGEGKILPPYVVFKAQHMYDSWRERGPKNSRYNRTKSGWFDTFCFSDWVESVAIPFFKDLEGTKYLIGDNLASHLSLDLIKLCNETNIKFIFLPSNSTHLTQPLDVAFFRPMKMCWRNILEEWKKGPGRGEASVPKDRFAGLLKQLCDSLKEDNVVAGFRKCGIVPLDRNKVLNMLPKTDLNAGTNNSRNGGVTPVRVEAIDDTFKELLSTLRQYDSVKQKKKRTKVSVTPGKSVEVKELEEPVVVEDKPGFSGTNIGDPAIKQAHKRPKKKRPRLMQDSSSSGDSDYSVQDSDNEFVLSSEEEPEVKERSEDLERPKNPENSYRPGDFLVVKVYGKTKDTHRLYVTKVLYIQGDGYIGVFYKRAPSTWNFSQTEEEAFIPAKDILKQLKLSLNQNKSARFKDMVSFENDLSDLMLY